MVRTLFRIEKHMEAYPCKIGVVGMPVQLPVRSDKMNFDVAHRLLAIHLESRLQKVRPLKKIPTTGVQNTERFAGYRLQIVLVEVPA